MLTLIELKGDLKKSKKEFMKTLNNTNALEAQNQVSDIQFFGNGDTFKLICKASSKNENWMKSTKAMQIDNLGCVVQVTTQQGDNVSEALTFVPNTKIKEIKDSDGKVIERKLVSMYYNDEDKK